VKKPKKAPRPAARSSRPPTVMTEEALRDAIGRTRDAERLMEIGLELADRGLHDAAIRAYDAALLIAPDASVHYNRGNALHELGRREEAVDAHRAALARDPAFVKPMVNLADELMALGRTDEALSMAQMALAHDPDLPDALLHATRAETRLGRWDRALEHWALLHAFGFGPDAEDLRAAVDAARGSPDLLAEARALLRCAARRPGFSKSLKIRLYDDAARRAERAGAERPEAALVLARAFLNHPQRAAESERNARRALEADLPEAHTVMGYILGRSKDSAKDLREPWRLHSIAAERGVADSQFELSIYLDRGIGGPLDHAAARTWERRAADQGHQRALFNVASFAARGDFAPPDLGVAVEYYERAALAGSFEAAQRLAVMFGGGAGVAPDPERAVRWARVALSLESDGPLAVPDADRLAPPEGFEPYDAMPLADVALLAAAGASNIDGVRQALDDGASPDAYDPTAEMPVLMLAVLQRQDEVARLLLESGADPNAGASATHAGSLVGVSVLDIAQDEGRRELVDLLIAHGAVPPSPRGASRDRREKQSDVRGRAGSRATKSGKRRAGDSGGDLTEALRTAVDLGDVAEVRRLLAAGADPNTKNSLGTGSMLCMAAYAGDLELARALLDAGADPNLPDEAPLVLALDAGHYDAAELLAELGASPGHGAGSSRTALHHLLFLRPSARAVSWLLAHGADPDARDDAGDPPLLVAARDGHVEIVAVLLRGGTDPSAKNGVDSPLAAAKHYKHKKIIALLKEAGART
jgi:ankyrin repeat protein/tetratricopeptide (TPR) repeat protein